jgi:hypothetical protein
VAEKSRFCRRRGSKREHAGQFVRKARVQQAIGFVEHERRDTGQAERVVIDQVQQSTRGGHDHFRPAAQAHHLRVDGHAAEHDGHLDRFGEQPGEAANRLSHLGRELPRGHEHEGAVVPRCCARHAFELLQQRQGERHRLAGTGLRRGQHVAAAQGRRNGGRLDRGGHDIALSGRGANERGRQPERRKRVHRRLAFTDLPFTFPAFNPRNALSAMPRSTAT